MKTYAFQIQTRENLRVYVELTNDWVWDAEDNPKVFELCEAGLNTLHQIIRYRDEMKFPD